MYVTTDAAATRHLGAELGRAMPAGALVLLSGPLGSGKTTLAQGIAAGMGVTGRVVSPTFVLVREYDTPRGVRLVHMDFYRLSGAAEAGDLGLADYLSAQDVVLIEWPERADWLLPDEALRIDMMYRGDGRRIELTAVGDLAAEALRALPAHCVYQHR